MKMIERFLFSILVLLWLHTPSVAQLKYEEETRLKLIQVPERAIVALVPLRFQKKVKWYREESLDGVSIEAKTKHRSEEYSIEFDSLGNLQDVEIERKEKCLPKNLLKKIVAYLDSSHHKAKIRKVQVQYSGNQAQIFRAISQGKEPEEGNGVLLRYELIAKVKDDDNRREMEYLFDRNGSYLRSASLISTNPDILEF